MARTRLHTAVLLIAAVWPATAAAQAPVGAEFRVNTYTTGADARPSVGVAPAGGFVVTWDSDRDGSSFGVFGQRFAADGSPAGAEFQANSYTFGGQNLASVRASDGGFVVAWQSSGQDGYGAGVFARRFATNGAPLGGELRVNVYTTGGQVSPVLALTPAGGFVAAWATPDDSQYGIGGQRIDGANTPLPSDIQVNLSTTGPQRRAAVAADAAGNFVVTWEDFNFTHRGIWGQRFDSGGARRGAEFRVNSAPNSEFGYSSVAMDAAGGFVVAWESISIPAPPPAPPSERNEFVHVQRFDTAGGRVGAEFMVPSSFHAERPAAASDAAGNSVVVWRSNTVGAKGIFGARFDAAGARVGAQFRVDEGAFNTQGPISVGMDDDGRFVVAWMAIHPDASSAEIHARRFEARQPAGLELDPEPSSGSDGNLVFEAGESVLVAPSWRNFSASTFGGSAVAFTGPGDPPYTITDGTAFYGQVASGETRSCIGGGGDCYVLSIAQPSARPAPHWDAAFDESLTPPDEHGGFTRWTLHVGESFTDVPRGNPFYRFIETLLHRGVTAGCAAGQYCPASATTREQMAVFVLLAKQGPAYSPPACAPPNTFADVPETSAFCRWIEDLARRQVVSGCGNGLYCPTAPVTREQMAVFVLKTLDFFLQPAACEPPNLFTDVPETSPFCPWIEELARRGVVGGCAPGLYCPTQAVSREQMGVFLGVTFGLTLYGP